MSDILTTDFVFGFFVGGLLSLLLGWYLRGAHEKSTRKPSKDV